ncbi:MAG: PQQ-binding-like beta-propeller repeat protein [Thermoguttaceae bacterium]|nr:PQQ-binding-like beta-propeller repeat protein [Thermoguttaceae bacterium]
MHSCRSHLSSQGNLGTARPIPAFRTRVQATATLSLLIITFSTASGADWPTFRGDTSRSGVAAESLVLPLGEAWVHQASNAPRPAWPESPAKQDVWHRLAWMKPVLSYDWAFQIAVADGRAYFGSSADDTVYCLDAATGDTLWSFTTEGPVRLAPTVADGRVYVGSDDGCLYCLKGDDGALLWQHRAGPEDRRLPGNCRMISLWPIRSGAVIEDGNVYFCAGLFPDQGTYLTALDARDGKLLFKQPLGISPEGHVLASAEQLVVPAGRTAPQRYQRSDGKDLGSVPGGFASRAGGTFALLSDEWLVHSSGEDGMLFFYDTSSQQRTATISGLRLVVQGSIAYVLGRDRLQAVDLPRYLDAHRDGKTPAQQKRRGELDNKAYVKWDVACKNPHELIAAGETLFVGGEDRVVAYRAADGARVWTGVVSGEAHGLAVAGGRLFVSTDMGTIHCFSSDAGTATTAQATPASPFSSPYPDDEQSKLPKQLAEKIIAAAVDDQGYCLVLGAGNGRLPYEIAKGSGLQVIALEPDAAKAENARKLLRQAGMYGTRVSVHCGTLDSVRYQPYFANVIAVADEAAMPDPAEVWRVLRPCGGTLAVVLPPDASEGPKLAAWGAEAIPGWTAQKDADGFWMGTAQRGPLPGAGKWSHLYADAGNSACSGDQLAQGPISVQWFGRPGPERMPDRHDKTVGPLCVGGRLFITGDNYIAAIDAYNGTVLWDRDVPDSIRLGPMKNCGNMAASDDTLYVAAAGRCLAFDARTGRQKFAAACKGEWGYVATVDDLLLGSETRRFASYRYQTLDTEVLIWRDHMPVVCSDSLFALDRQSGEKRWDYAPAPSRGVIINPTIAAGGGRVYFVESANPETRDAADGRIRLNLLLGKGADLVALDLHSGKPVWSKPVSLEQLEHAIYLSYSQETVLITGTRNAMVEEQRRVRYDLAAFDAATGDLLWQNTQIPVPDHILQGPHGEQVQHSAIVGDTIYNTGFACSLRTGEPAAGWKWQKSPTCGTVTTSAHCAFSRFSNARMFDLQTGEHTDLTTVVRPGCWINIIPAGGLVLVPEAAAGCICGYPLQTSIAFLPVHTMPSRPSSRE